VIPLPVANLIRHKRRSAISALGVGVGIALLVLLPSLADGMIGEVVDRMQNVDADLMAYPHDIDPIMDTRAAMETGDEAEFLKVEGIQRVIPIAVESQRLANQPQRIFGVRPGDLSYLDRRFSEVKLVAGRIFGRDSQEILIDDRLARAGGYQVDDTVTFWGRKFRIVGIVPAGAAARVLMPLKTMQRIVYKEPNVTFFFVKCEPPLPAIEVGGRVGRALDLSWFPLAEYARMLESHTRQIRQFLGAITAVALVISFFVILVTMYTAVQGRTREIGILKSLGAGHGLILRGVLVESVALCVAGAILGSLLAWAGGQALQWQLPLLTVRIGWHWIAWGFAAAVGAGALGALYPGWVACRMDAVRSLSYE